MWGTYPPRRGFSLHAVQRNRERAVVGKESLRWRVVRPLFELLYTNRVLYWAASTIPFAGKWRTWQRLVLPRLHGRDVLEVGCGPGALLIDLLAAGYQCKAIDRSPQMVAAAQGRLRRAGHDPATVHQADVRQLPFAGASFDNVVSTFPTEYIVDPHALAEIARVLRPGGRLIVVLGATLVPANVALLPFVAIQRLIYGRSVPSPTTTPSTAETSFARLLRSVGLVPREEIVRVPSWRAVLYSGEKSA